jgi:hypothetical protein
MKVQLIYVHLAPGTQGMVLARSGGAVCVDAKADLWLSLGDGRKVATPSTAPTTVPTAWEPGLYGYEAPASVAVPQPAARQMKGEVVRAQAAGKSVLVDTVRGNTDTRAIYWVTDERAAMIRDRVPDRVRVEAIGDGRAVLVDADARILDFLTLNEPDARVPLPSWLSLPWHLGAARYMWSLPDEGVLVLESERALVWAKREELVGARRSDVVEWVPQQVVPQADMRARIEGKVLFVSPSMTLIQAGSQRVTIKAQTSCTKNDSVVVEGSLWDGAFMTLQRTDGTTLRIAPFPEYQTERAAVEAATPARQAGLGGPERKRVTKALDDLRVYGIGRDLTGHARDELLDGIDVSGRAVPEIVFEVLTLYYQEGDNDARAVAEGYLSHDWRFGQETDDVVAELSARVGRPLLRQLGMKSNIIEVERASGRLDIEVESLDDVVRAYNQALADAGDARRFVAVDTQGDWHAYFLLLLDVVSTIRGKKLLPLTCEP